MGIPNRKNSKRNEVCSVFTCISLQWVASVDLFPNEEAQANVIVTKLESWVEQNEEVGFLRPKWKSYQQY